MTVNCVVVFVLPYRSDKDLLIATWGCIFRMPPTSYSQSHRRCPLCKDAPGTSGKEDDPISIVIQFFEYNILASSNRMPGRSRIGLTRNV